MTIVAVVVAPHTPVIDVAKCSRSKNSVVLVLSPPLPENDVIDGYKVYYCSELHQASGEQVKLNHSRVR